MYVSSVKTEWTWNVTYQKLFDKEKPMITQEEIL